MTRVVMTPGVKITISFFSIMISVLLCYPAYAQSTASHEVRFVFKPAHRLSVHHQGTAVLQKPGKSRNPDGFDIQLSDPERDQQILVSVSSTGGNALSQLEINGVETAIDNRSSVIVSGVPETEMHIRFKYIKSKLKDDQVAVMLTFMDI
ncbi:hypothetical protein JW948_03780 [bacterium]|nr:hypothetical protein [bacterium]